MIGRIVTFLAMLGFCGAAAQAQVLYLSDSFDYNQFSPHWSIAGFQQNLYTPSNQAAFVDLAGHQSAVHYYIPRGVDEVTPAQMSVEGEASFQRLTGRPQADEFYLEWSEFFPEDHNFADHGQKMVRFDYWKAGEERGTEMTFAVLDNNSRMQVFLYHPRGQLNGRTLDIGLDAQPIPVGRWVRLGLWVRQNTPGAADGFVYLYLDGQLILSQTNMSIRGRDTRGWNIMWIGGNHSNSTGPTRQASHRYIDDVLWYSSKPGGVGAPPVMPPGAGVPQSPVNWRPAQNPATPLADYNRDGISDYAVWRPGSGTWFALTNEPSGNAAAVLQRQWGVPGDMPVRGDFDGDGYLDLTVWRPGSGVWYICPSSSGYDCGQGANVQFGLWGDFPLSGDIDGDGKDDLIVWRAHLDAGPMQIIGQWYYMRSSDGGFGTVQFGLPGDIPNTADFDGDGRDDLVIYRPQTGQWYRKSVAEGGSLSEVPLQWGLPGDYPLPADYDGDGIADAAVWRPASGMWYICPSSAGPQTITCSGGAAVQLGLPGDIPVAGDFDGSGAASPGVWRPKLGAVEGTWYTLNLTNWQIKVQQWGLMGDLPIGIRSVNASH